MNDTAILLQVIWNYQYFKMLHFLLRFSKALFDFSKRKNAPFQASFLAVIKLKLIME